jgi:hypothetical protein
MRSFLAVREVVEPALVEVLEAMYFFTPEWRGIGRLEGPLQGAAVKFLVSAPAGQEPDAGEFRLIVTQRLATRMAAEFLPAEPEDITPAESEAMIAELANVVSGAVLSVCMPGVEFQLAIPRTFRPVSDSEVFNCGFAVLGGAAGRPERTELAVDVRLDGHS